MRENSLLKGNAIFEKYIRKNFFKYALIVSLYLIGFLVGIVIFNNNISEEEQANVIFQDVTEKIGAISETPKEVIENYIKRDFMELATVCILSFSIIGVPIILILIFVKSISLGTTVSALIYTEGVGGGLSFSILVFMVPAIIKIFALLIITCSSLKYIENTLKYKKEVKYEITRHALSVLVIFILTCILALYRTFSLKLVSQIMI